MVVAATIALAEVVALTQRGADYYQLTVKVPPESGISWADPGLFAKLRTWDLPPANGPVLDIPLSVHRYRPDSLEADFLIRPVGPGTKALVQSQPGDQIRLTGPLGQGLSQLDPNFAQKPFYLVAGGVGLAPMASLLDRVKAPTALFYGERRGAALIDRDYLSSFAANFQAATEDGLGYGQKGRVADLVAVALAKEKRDLFACGPIGLLAALAPLAKSHKIRYFAAAEAFMACGLGVCLSCGRSLKDGTRIRLCLDGPVVDGLAFDWEKP
jgi:dihydroorotate dehydrogenase electron transfer subunit